MEIISYKIFGVQKEDFQLECLNTTGTKTYRIEEIPRDQVDLSPDELLVPVAHFNKEIFSTFGVPFFLKIRNGEPFEQVKLRIQQKLEVPDKEFEKVG